MHFRDVARAPADESEHEREPSDPDNDEEDVDAGARVAQQISEVEIANPCTVAQVTPPATAAPERSAARKCRRIGFARVSGRQRPAKLPDGKQRGDSGKSKQNCDLRQNSDDVTAM